MAPANNIAHIPKLDKDADEEGALFNDLLRLYMKKIDVKLELLEEWETSVLEARKGIEEGRKSVLA
mgnify:FL=1